MRFFMCDRVVAAVPGERISAVKAFSLMDGHLGQHYPRRAVLPASLVVEALAQVGGLLNLLSRGFAVEMVLMLVDGVQFTGQPQQGEPVTLDVRMLYEHPYGATMSGTAAVGDTPVATVDRLVFAHEVVTDADIIARNRRRFAYQAGDVDAGISGEPR